MLDGVPGCDPVEKAFGLFCPKGVGLLDGLAIKALVFGLTELRGLADGIGVGECADIEHERSLFLFWRQVIKMHAVGGGYKANVQTDVGLGVPASAAVTTAEVVDQALGRSIL